MNSISCQLAAISMMSITKYSTGNNISQYTVFPLESCKYKVSSLNFSTEI